MKNQNHGLWMIICCIAPLLLIFLLPAIGVRSNNSLLFFVLAMFACHFLMMGRHGHSHEDENQDENNKEESHEGHEKKEKHVGHGGCH